MPREPLRTTSTSDAGFAGGGRNERGDLVGADGDGRGIARNVNAQGHAWVSLMSASRRPASKRPTTRPSIMADGAVAQRPRQ